MVSKLDTLNLPVKSSAARWATRWLIGYWLLLVLLTHWPNPWPHVSEPKYLDKVVHFFIYGVLAGLGLNALLRRDETASVVVRSIGVLAAVTAFGLLDETTQPLTGRDFDWFDWLADSLGALTAIIAYNCWRLRGKYSLSAADHP